nr:hypothetical protein [Tanacetum cinerariifolium]
MSLTNELKSFNSKVESPGFKETVVDKEKSSKRGRKIADIDVDAKVNLENVYNLDLAHEETVLISTVGGELNAANEEPVSAAPTNITIAQPSEATKTTVDITTAPKAKGIVFYEVEESTTRPASSKVDTETEWNAACKTTLIGMRLLNRKNAELESRVEKLEEKNMSLTNELKSFNSKVESPGFKETVVDKEKSSKRGRKIADIDVDAKVNLENVYNLDLAHEETVLISTVGGELNAANEEPVSAAPTNITIAQPNVIVVLNSFHEVVLALRHCRMADDCRCHSATKFIPGSSFSTKALQN